MDDRSRDPKENEGGLFSDDHATPKRENPYKNRKSQTRARSGDDADAPVRTPRRNRLEDFWFEHVKLIVFIISMVIVVMLLGPFSVFRIAEYVEEQQKQAEMAAKDELTLDYIEALTRKSEPIHWDDFRRFYYEEYESSAYGESVLWILSVGSDYQIRVGGANTQSPPRLCVYV